MSAMGQFDITNGEQLRILQERLDELAAERAATNERIDRLVAQGKNVTQEWQIWRRSIDMRLAAAQEAIAERLAHPLMDPATVEELRRAQRDITAHLTVQDGEIAALRLEIAPFTRVTKTLERLTKRLSWALLLLGGGALYETGKLLVDWWVR